MEEKRRKREKRAGEWRERRSEVGESGRERREESVVSFQRECPEGRRNNASWRNYILLLSPTRTKAQEEKKGPSERERIPR